MSGCSRRPGDHREVRVPATLAVVADRTSRPNLLAKSPPHICDGIRFIPSASLRCGGVGASADASGGSYSRLVAALPAAGPIASASGETRESPPTLSPVLHTASWGTERRPGIRSPPRTDRSRGR